jgi:glycosyltransferase involved in cell wall biosynthesis
MSPPAVAVIVPVFNRAGLVIEALSSIAAQTQPPRRLVIVDDGSTDGGGEAIERWIGSGEARCDARLIRQANLGAPAARNRAIREAADCQWIAFLDSDDLWPADYLGRIARAAIANPQAVALTSDHRVLNVATEKARLIAGAPFDGNITGVLFQRMLPLPSCTVVRAEPFHRAGGFNERYRQGLEDVELFLRMSLLGQWRYVPGEPVTRRIETRSGHGGPDQLSAQHTDRHDSTRATVELFHRFLFVWGGASKLPPSMWRRIMAQGWTSLARQSEAAGDRSAAAADYHRAWRVDRRHIGRLFRSWWLRATAR